MKRRILIVLMSLTLALSGCGSTELKDANASLQAEVESLEAELQAAKIKISDAETRQKMAEDRASEAAKKLQKAEEIQKEAAEELAKLQAEAELERLKAEEAAKNPFEVKAAALNQSDVPSYTAQIGDTELYDRGVWKNLSFYELDTKQTVGVLNQSNLRSTASHTIPYEAFYGVQETSIGHTISFTPYNHAKKDHAIERAEIISDQGDSLAITLEYGQTTNVDCSKLSQGLYQQKTYFDEAETELFFYVASNGVFPVKADDFRNVKALIQRLDRVEEEISKAGVTPENCLSIEDIIYPCADSEGHRCDTGRWAQLSHDLLDSHPSWSDEMKLFCLAEWMTKNIAYDDWKVKNGHSRAYSLGVWDGTYAMWNTRVGVCADFTNVMVIMLREQGIPTTSLESDTHAWNAVFIDGRWREVDITDMLAFHVDDFEHENWTDSHVSFSQYLGYKSTKIVTVGDDIWTRERASRK